MVKREINLFMIRNISWVEYIDYDISIHENCLEILLCISQCKNLSYFFKIEYIAKTQRQIQNSNFKLFDVSTDERRLNLLPTSYLNVYLMRVTFCFGDAINRNKS